MITKFKLYTVQCDLCEMHYPGKKAMPDHPVIYFPGKEELYQAIKDAGWLVMHNKENDIPHILCPSCNAMAEFHMGTAKEEMMSRGS
ncbi:MAG: hypothetical protein V2B15_08710 [Bacteroidota bacterium]